MKQKVLLSMNKIIAIIVVGVFISITSYNYNPDWSNTASADTTDINPNKSSELSLLMRKMYDHAAEARQALASNKKVSYPKSFLQLIQPLQRMIIPRMSITQHLRIYIFRHSKIMNLLPMSTGLRATIIL